MAKNIQYQGNPRYYSLSPGRRAGKRTTWAPPPHVARTLAQDGYAYGKPLTTKQRALFARIGMVFDSRAKGKKRSVGRAYAKRGRKD